MIVRISCCQAVSCSNSLGRGGPGRAGPADFGLADAGCVAVLPRLERLYMDPSSVASIPFFGGEVRLLTYIRPLTAASL